MPDKRTSAQLVGVDLEILKLLWMEWYHHSKQGVAFEGGLTRRELFERLNKKLGTDGKPLVRTAGALKPHLAGLEEHKPVLILSQEVQRADGKAGGWPEVYMIAWDSTITWPSTAFLVQYLWDFPGSQVERQVLIDEILKKKIMNSSTRKTVTEDELSRQIDWCLRWNYLDYVSETVLRPTARARFELRLLEFIARDVAESFTESGSSG